MHPVRRKQALQSLALTCSFLTFPIQKCFLSLHPTLALMCTSTAESARLDSSMGWPKLCAFPEGCQYCTFLTEQNVQMLQRLSSARDSSRQFLSSVAECKSLLEVFDTVVNLRCSIRFVKPAKGGKAQVKAALSRMRLLTGSDFCFLWQVEDLFQCPFPFLKKKKKKAKKKPKECKFFQPKPCDPKANTSCFCPCCTVPKFSGNFLHDCFSSFV